jgi:uncharacterized membrane protein
VWKRGDLRDRKILALGSAIAFAAALCLAVLRRTTAINIGIVNTWILSASFIAGIVCIVRLWRDDGAARPVRFSLSSAVLAGTLLFYTLPSLFLLPSEFVLAGLTVFSTEFLVNLAGAAMGLALVLIVCYALFRTGVQEGESLPLPPATGFLIDRKAVNLAPRNARRSFCFAIILSALLLVNMVNQAAEIVRFLMARRIIPMWRGLFKIIMAMVNNQNVFLFLGIGIAVMLPMVSLFFKNAGQEPERAGLNPAEIRKQKAALRRLRRYCGLALVLISFSVFALTGLKAWDRREVALSPPEPFTLSGAEILVPIERIEDGHLHRFAWNASDGTEVRFIVIKKSASAWGVGLDACDICGNTGYYERRDGVICKLCDVVMNKSTIGFKGGCNPVPLSYTVREGAMIVQTADLENEKGRFK